MQVQETAQRAIANRYVSSERIPNSGTSELFRATHAESRRIVVVREFVPVDQTPAEALSTLSKIASGSSRFLNELLDAVLLPDNRVLAVHPFLSGESLDQRLERKTKLDAEGAASLWLRMAKGLDALHGRGLVHGGLRPSRVFHVRAASSKGWHVKLLSAGVRSIPREAAKKSPALVRYMPPEWLAGGAWTAQSDFWCAAAILFECVAGTSPFGGGTAEEIEARIMGAAPPPIYTVVPEVPTEFAQLLADSLSPDPLKRPENANSIIDALIRMFPGSRGIESPQQDKWTRGRVVARPGDGQPVMIQSPTEVRRRQRRALNRAQLSAASAVAILAAAAIALLYLKHRDQERDLLARLDHDRAVQQQEVQELQRRAAAVAAQAPTQVVAAPQPAAPAADAGVVVASAAPLTHHASHMPESRPIAAPDPSTESGALEFRAASPCALMLDGINRGDVSYLQTTLHAGPHSIACRGGSSTQRLIVRIEAGRVTRVHVNTTGESVISTEPGRGT